MVGIWRHLTSFKSRYNAPGAGAVEAERIKDTRYEGALRRLHRTRGIETDIDQWVVLQKRNFYAAGFECTGALGPGMQQLLVRIENSARVRATGADLYHWSNMTFRNHWRTTMGTAIMRNVARCLQSAGLHAARQPGGIVSGGHGDDGRTHDGLDAV